MASASDVKTPLKPSAQVSPSPPSDSLRVLHLSAVRTRTRGTVFKLVGYIGPHRFTALVDSGAEGLGFINTVFAERCGLPLSPSQNSVQLADGTVVAAAGVATVNYTLMPTKGAAIPFTSQFTATPLESYDIILGVGWLEQHDVLVGWRERCLEVRTPGRASRHIRPIEVFNDGSALPAQLATISHKTLRKDLRRGRILEAYAVIVRPKHDPEVVAKAASNDPEVIKLLAEYSDVYRGVVPCLLDCLPCAESSTVSN